MTSSLQTKLLSIVGVFLIGFAIYATVVHRTTPNTLEESDYRDVMRMKDVISDALPPLVYAVEPMMFALEAARAPDKAARATLHEQWKQAERVYADRRAHWSDALEPGQIRTTLTETMRRGAERLFSLGDEQFWPALEAGDQARAEASLSEMWDAFREHRLGVEELRVALPKQVNANAAEAADTIRSRKTMLIILAIVIVLLGGTIAVVIARSISRRTSQMADVLSRIAAGDLAERAPAGGRDELGDIAQQLNLTLEAIERVFGEVRNVSTTVAEAAAHLAANSDQISHGAQQQAASLEETAASLEEITATIKQSAGHAQQANEVAIGSRDVAEKGGSVVAGAISAMDEITKASRKIGDIITTIDEIALQTNLLALNAAVEAARAGEQGRGFAVVAAEVGNLAQRSAAAAKEVKTLIQDSLERIQAGHALVGESGRALNDIIVSVKKVTELVGNIASGSREQSIGVDQVNQAVSQMDQVTQNSASQTDQLSHTAQALADSASQLNKLMLRFRLSSDGTSPRHTEASTGRTGQVPPNMRAARPRLVGSAEPSREFVAQQPANSNSGDAGDFEVLSPGGSRDVSSNSAARRSPL